MSARSHLHAFGLGAATLAALTLYLHEPPPRVSNKEIIDALAVVIDDTPVKSVKKDIPKPPKDPRGKEQFARAFQDVKFARLLENVMERKNQ